jgi:transcriptional regulator with XRE-family HTH domain
MPKPDPHKHRPKKTARKRPRAFTVKGSLLRDLRISRGWTQQEAADRAGVSDRTIRNAEMGGPLELRTIALLAALYSVPGAPITPKDILAKGWDRSQT